MDNFLNLHKLLTDLHILETWLSSSSSEHQSMRSYPRFFPGQHFHQAIMSILTHHEFVSTCPGWPIALGLTNVCLRSFLFPDAPHPCRASSHNLHNHDCRESNTHPWELLRD